MTETYLLMQISDADGAPRAVLLDGDMARPCTAPISTLELAHTAIAEATSLAAVIGATDWAPTISLEYLLADHHLLPPVTHPDPTHLHGTGTGLTHLGSAAARDKMHTATTGETDSMRMFRWGVEAGKPDDAAPGVQPEWFYKGNGHGFVAPGADLVSPGFAEDAGEEPELAGIYLIGPDGTPHRLGFALANEFSDHVTEKRNYLYLAHSKLRPFSIGPALRVGTPPQDIRGTSRILRNGQVAWSRGFLTGEANMSHSLANPEHHHFKYDIFRKPGEVHVHMFGTATLSFAEGFTCENGDVYEISVPGFGPPLCNPLRVEPATRPPQRLMVSAL